MVIPDGGLIGGDDFDAAVRCVVDALALFSVVVADWVRVLLVELKVKMDNKYAFETVANMIIIYSTKHLLYFLFLA